MTPEEARAIYAAGPETVARELCALHAQVVALQRQVMAQEKKIAEMSKNSTNSSKPPSSDITKPPKKKKNKGKKNKRGGQPGHPKHERNPFSPDEIDEGWGYHHLSCPECGNTDITLVDLPPRIIQQTELIEVVTRKEEHCAYAYYCGDCDTIHYAPFPDEVVKEGLFKARLTSLGRVHEKQLSCLILHHPQIPARCHRCDCLS